MIVNGLCYVLLMKIEGTWQRGHLRKPVCIVSSMMWRLLACLLRTCTL